LIKIVISIKDILPIVISRDGFEALVLISICKAVRMSKSAHVPEQSFMRKFPGKGGIVKKALRVLIREGYVQRHPTGSEMTFELTDSGWDLCRSLREESKN